VADDEKLKRERAGTYRSGDGRFTVEQSSSGWLLLDGEQADELGLPLARGPFGTLGEARSAITGARSGPAPTSSLAGTAGKGSGGRGRAGLRAVPSSRNSQTARVVRAPDAGPDEDDALERGAGGDETAGSKRPARGAARKAPARPARPAVLIREYRAVDGEGLRKLWAEAGFRSMGDDDLSLGRMVRRNPGLLLVAAEGSRIVGSALGAWDGRRGWIYHVATAASHRRQGIATRLLDQVEAALRDLGCPKVSVLVRDENRDGGEFWVARGYEQGSRQFARQLRED
jgi:ribosomal protein S18 acetylase RimI-like enzyme